MIVEKEGLQQLLNDKRDNNEFDDKDGDGDSDEDKEEEEEEGEDADDNRMKEDDDNDNNGNNSSKQKMTSQLQKLGAAVSRAVLSEWEKWDAALLQVLSARLDDLIIEVRHQIEQTSNKLNETKHLLVVGETDHSKKLVRRDRRRRLLETKEMIAQLEEDCEALEDEVKQAEKKKEVTTNVTKYGEALKIRKAKGRAGVDSQRKFLMLKDLLSFRTTELSANRIAVLVDLGTLLPTVNIAWKIDGGKGLARIEKDLLDIDTDNSSSSHVSKELFRLLSRRGWLRAAKLLGEHPAHELNDRLEQVCKIVGRMHLACEDIDKVFRGGENDLEVFEENEVRSLGE